jgi:hypothetical protein
MEILIYIFLQELCNLATRSMIKGTWNKNSKELMKRGRKRNIESQTLQVIWFSLKKISFNSMFSIAVKRCVFKLIGN